MTVHLSASVSVSVCIIVSGFLSALVSFSVCFGVSVSAYLSAPLCGCFSFYVVGSLTIYSLVLGHVTVLTGFSVF